jgi:hypothetical protein
VIAFLVLVMAFLRLAFLTVNWPVFKRFSSAELTYSFINGARFDLRVILLLYGLIFLFVHIPIRWKGGESVLRRVIFSSVVLFLPVLALSVLNVHYYAEAGRHLSYEIMAVGGDRNDLLASLKMIGNYRWSIFLFIVLSVILLQSGRMILARTFRPGNNPNLRSRFVWMLLFLCFTTLGFRGTVTGRPLRMHHAFVQGSTELGHLTLNPVFTVLESMIESEGGNPAFFTEEEALKTVGTLLDSEGTVWNGADAPLYRHKVDPRRESPLPYNLVILVLESWSPRYIGAYGSSSGLTQEFDQLAASGILFDDFYAVGSRTDEGRTGTKVLAVSFPTAVTGRSISTVRAAGPSGRRALPVWRVSINTWAVRSSDSPRRRGPAPGVAGIMSSWTGLPGFFVGNPNRFSPCGSPLRTTHRTTSPMTPSGQRVHATPRPSTWTP